MKLKLTLESSDAAELREARDLVDFLLQRSARSVRPSPRIAEAALDAAVAEVLKPKVAGSSYRWAYLWWLAEAGDEGASLAELIEKVFDNQAQRYGGTRTAIQRSWQRGGGDAFGPLIEDFEDGRQVMLEAVRDTIKDRAWNNLEEVMVAKLRRWVRERAPESDRLGQTEDIDTGDDE